MKAELLFKADGTAVGVWYCGACGRLHSSTMFIGDEIVTKAQAKLAADECCTQAKCCLCQADLGRLVNIGGLSACASCRAKDDKLREQNKIDKAVKVDPRNLTDKDHLFFGDEHFFSGLDEFLEWAADQKWTREQFPLAVWVCEARKPAIDTERVIEDFAENLELADGIKVEDVTVDLDGLRAVIADWNSNQEPSIWYPRDDECVLVGISDIDICPACLNDGSDCVACGDTGRQNPDGP